MVVGILKTQTYAILLVVFVTPSLAATLELPTSSHDLLLDDAMRCDGRSPSRERREVILYQY